ncbi:hypothetical protein C6501_16815 [Candidatus Poribacteria bacterium]|nr:MAG: hypothetical protein C6501_16815 [Candidatus Poribacteria bacterium]
MPFDLEALIPIIIFLLVMIFGSTRRRKTDQRPAGNDQSRTENTTQVDTVPESEAVFPPFMENFEGFPTGEAELAEETVESNQVVAEQPEPETVQEPTPEREPIEPPPVPVDSPTPLPTKPVPITSLIDPSPETFRQGIILAEILGRPKTLQNRRR